MDLYNAFLLEVSGRPEGSTLSHLRHMGKGKYAEIVDDCIRKNLIGCMRKNTMGEDLYFITIEGKEYLNK